MHIILFILIFIGIIFILGITLIGSLFRALFGFGKKATRPNNTQYQQRQAPHTTYYSEEESSNGGYSTTETTHHAKKHKKIFSDDEGEYVDFEEVKE